MKNDKKIDRAAFAEMVKSGATAKEIMGRFGVTRQAVSKRAISLGLTVSMAEPARVSRPARPSAISLRYGMPHDVIAPLIACGATRAFIVQRQNARSRGVAWDLTFAEWWAIWSESGEWERRGRSTERAVMARYGDKGPYAKGNVYICTQNQNMKDANRWRRESKQKALDAGAGEPPIIAAEDGTGC